MAEKTREELLGEELMRVVGLLERIERTTTDLRSYNIARLGAPPGRAYNYPPPEARKQRKRTPNQS